MKSVNIKELRELSDEELNKKVYELKDELFHLRQQKATGSLASPARFRFVKRQIARILTILRERKGGIQ